MVVTSDAFMHAVTVQVPNDPKPLRVPMQARLHAARPALSRRVRSLAVNMHGGDSEEAEPSALLGLYPLLACTPCDARFQ